MSALDERNLRQLKRRINAGTCIPIISNRLFFPDQSRLLHEWAKNIDYPFPVDHHTTIATVAQYLGVVSNNNPALAREEFLEFMKQDLLKKAQKDAGDDNRLLEMINMLQDELPDLSLSTLAHRLQYPDNPSVKNILDILGDLPFPLYITTSYHDFISRALTNAGKKPRQEIGIWDEDLSTNIPSIFKLNQNGDDSNYTIGDPKEPTVYHLLGVDDLQYSPYIVLTEDDYLNFLLNTPKYKGKPEIDLIPVNIRSHLATSTLLLIGFHLNDWDFKVLFHSLLKGGKKMMRGTNVAIQLSPDEDRYGTNNEKIRQFLEGYFDNEKFAIHWGTTEEFLQKITI